MRDFSDRQQAAVAHHWQAAQVPIAAAAATLAPRPLGPAPTAQTAYPGAGGAAAVVPPSASPRQVALGKAMAELVTAKFRGAPFDLVGRVARFGGDAASVMAVGVLEGELVGCDDHMQ